MPSVLKYLVPASLIIVGLIHLMPLPGVLGVDHLNVLYGTSISDPDLSILMRHRAVLFGLLGAFCIYAVIKPSLQLIALVAGTVSVTSFLILASGTGEYNDALRRVFIADVFAAAFLAIGFAGYFFRRSVGGT